MLNVVFIVTALLVSAAPAMAGVTFTFFTGANCAGSVIGTSTGSSAGECIYLSNGGSGKSIGYSGVPDSDSVSLFELSGSGLPCSTDVPFELGGGSGCGTAPTGFNFSSVMWF